MSNFKFWYDLFMHLVLKRDLVKGVSEKEASMFRYKNVLTN